MATSYLLRCLSAVGPGRAVKLNQLLSAAAPASASPLGKCFTITTEPAPSPPAGQPPPGGGRRQVIICQKTCPYLNCYNWLADSNHPPQKKKKTSQCVSSNQVFDKVNFIHHLFIQVQKKVWDKKIYFLKWDLAKRAAEMATNIMAL